MTSIATKNKSKDRSKNEQFHSRQQKTKDKHNFVIHDIITQLQQVKAALQQATHDGKICKWLFKKQNRQ